jgi:hypothetical protein
MADPPPDPIPAEMTEAFAKAVFVFGDWSPYEAEPKIILNGPCLSE